MDKFKLFTVSQSSENRKETEGAVQKTWVQTSEGQALFKEADISPYYDEIRSDWPEKIASELANRLRLPAARYELAQLEIESSQDAIPGSISFELSDYNGEREPLEAFLKRSIENYNYGSDYNVSSVINILEEQNVQLPPDYSLPEGINNGADMFVGALMLDAYTSNIDRHSRNFDVITDQNDGTKYLSPIFDNGRSLGSYLNDDIKVSRSISDYSKSAQSSITVEGHKKNGLEVFKEAARLRPQAAEIWQNQLSQIPTQEIRELFARIPEDRITPISRDFASNLVSHNQSQLLSLELSYQQDKSLTTQNLSAGTVSTVDTSIPIEDVKFELASSAKYIALKEGKEIIDSVDGVTIEKQDNLSIRYEGKSIEFDRDFNVISNEFSDRELRQLNQQVRENKQQLKEQSQQIDRDRRIQRDNGLSL